MNCLCLVVLLSCVTYIAAQSGSWSDWKPEHCEATCGNKPLVQRRKCKPKGSTCDGESKRKVECEDLGKCLSGCDCHWSDWSKCKRGLAEREIVCDAMPANTTGLSCNPGFTQLQFCVKKNTFVGSCTPCEPDCNTLVKLSHLYDDEVDRSRLPHRFHPAGSTCIREPFTVKYQVTEETKKKKKVQKQKMIISVPDNTEFCLLRFQFVLQNVIRGGQPGFDGCVKVTARPAKGKDIVLKHTPIRNDVTKEIIDDNSKVCKIKVGRKYEIQLRELQAKLLKKKAAVKIRSVEVTFAGENKMIGWKMIACLKGGKVMRSLFDIYD